MEFLNKRKWVLKESEEDELIHKILDINGITDRDKFLNSTLSNMHDGNLMNDLKLAKKIIQKTIDEKGKIVLYTDYDTDGATGGAVGVLMLRELGADVEYYTNSRILQGYGLVKSGVDEIKELYPNVSLIITIDNGISAFDGIDYCNELGIDVIITDHHDTDDKLPNALAVVNPKREDTTYPFDGLCGAAVVWKVLQELYEEKSDANKYLDILAIGTVGDVVPLVDENRIIVKEGLKLLNNESRLSLKILKELTDTSVVKSDTIGFLYSPIFNAISRLKGDIDPVIDFLISEDEKEIRKIIEKLIETNKARKEKTDRQLEIAREILEKKEIEKVIVIHDKRFDEGIVGLIAGRLKEEYNRPVFVFTDSNDKDVIKGSARSIPNFHIKNILDTCSDLLVGHGGHELAGGMSLKKRNLEKLEDYLIKKSYEYLTEDDYIKEYHYIDTLKEEDINMNLIEELNKLEPYGEGFRKPLIQLHDFHVKRVFTMGEDKNHLKLTGEHINLIAFRQVEHYNERGNPLQVTTLGYPEINVFNNNVSIQFMVNQDNLI